MRELDVKIWSIPDESFVDYYSISYDLVHVAMGDQYYLSNDVSGPQEKDQFILCFFTGQMDKNNKKIYQGDVFHLGDPNIKYVVEFIGGAYMGRQIGNKSTVGLNYWKDNIEIVGNMYENPNLLLRL